MNNIVSLAAVPPTLLTPLSRQMMIGQKERKKQKKMKRKKKTEENVEDTKKGIKEGMKEKKQIYGELT